MPSFDLAKWIAVYFAAKLVGCVGHIAPGSSGSSLQGAEIRMLYSVSTQGPGGFDDGVLVDFMDDPGYFAPGVAYLLGNSSDRPEDKEMALYFAEFVSGFPPVATALTNLKDRETSIETKQLIDRMLADPNGVKARAAARAPRAPL